MKVARLVVLGIAGIAGIGAAILSAGQNSAPPQQAAPQPVAQPEMTQILVAKADLGIGDRITPQNVQWQEWPANAANSQYIRKSDEPDGGIAPVSGAIVRTPFVGGEPIRQTKLIKADGAGYMAAMLPSGMRAMSIEISPETAASGFILPKDRVDLILTRADRTPNGEEYSSETLLTNVPVLAIDQNVEEKNGQHVVSGRIATVELTLRQAETVALARRLGTLSLVLRSLAEPNERSGFEDLNRRDSVRVVRFGTTTRF
jgi:pilus assembly protein CpaB